MVAEGQGVGERWSGNVGLADANSYIGWINNKVLLYSTGNYIQYPEISIMEKNIYLYVCVCIYIYIYMYD